MTTSDDSEMGLAAAGNSTLGTDITALNTGHGLSIDAGGHQQPCIFCWYQQETPVTRWSLRAGIWS